MSKYAPHKSSSSQPRATSSTVCQKCLKTGHFIYQCKFERPYVSRPSRTELLESPAALAKLKAAGTPSVEVPDEFKNKSGVANKILADKEREREREKERTSRKRRADDEEPPTKKQRRRSASSSSSSSSDSDSDSDSGSDSDSDSSSGSDSGSSRTSSRSRSRRRSRRSPSRSASPPRTRR